MDYIPGIRFKQKIAGMTFLYFDVDMNLGGHGFESVSVDPEEPGLGKAA
jgi:hypothetical protein